MGDLVLSNARVLDGRGGIAERATVRLSGGRVAEVLPDPYAKPGGPEVVDLSGMTLMPALVDVPVHLSSYPTLPPPLRGEEPRTAALPHFHLAPLAPRPPPRPRRPRRPWAGRSPARTPCATSSWPTSPATSSRWASSRCATSAARGSTPSTSGRPSGSGRARGRASRRARGAEGGHALPLGQAVRLGLCPGPRILTCARIVSATSPGCRVFGSMYRPADGPDEVRKAAREQLAAGADFVKVMATGARSVVLENPETAQLTRGEVRAVVEEAHRLGKRVAAHAEGLEGSRPAIGEGGGTGRHGS